jgi:glycine/D-amino acid oxidase-like deaminating enzyme
VASYADAARRENVEIVEGIKVQAILRSNDRVVGVETNEGRIESRCVVLTTGPWTAALAKTMGLDLPVSPCRTQVALFRRPPNFGRRVATHVDFVQGIYFKPTHGDMIHIGSVQGEEIDDQVDPDHYNEAASGDWLPLMRQRLTRRYPGMYKGYGRGGFGALYAITPDWHPILDRLPGLQGGYCAVGFSGHGFKMAPTVGQLMAELIVDQKTSTFDIAPLRASRFAEQDLVKIKYAYGVIG